MSALRKQRDKILALLVQARGAWVPLPQITECAAQYNARIFELRRLGFAIHNRTEFQDGVRHSWFRLVPNEMATDAPRVLQAEGDGVLFAPDPARAQSLALAYETGQRGG